MQIRGYSISIGNTRFYSLVAKSLQCLEFSYMTHKITKLKARNNQVLVKNFVELPELVELSFAFITINREGLIGVSAVGWRNSLVTLTPFPLGKDCHYTLKA